MQMVAQSVALWVLIATLVIIAIHPTLQRLGIVPDKYKDETLDLLRKIHSLLDSEENRRKLEGLPSILEGVEKLVDQHEPPKNKKLPWICECNERGEIPSFDTIVRKLDELKEGQSGCQLHRKQWSEKVILANDQLERVVEVFLKRLGGK